MQATVAPSAVAFDGYAAPRALDADELPTTVLGHSFGALLAAEFAAGLDAADEVLLLPVFGAREEPLPGVSSQLIADRGSTAPTSLMCADY